MIRRLTSAARDLWLDRIWVDYPLSVAVVAVHLAVVGLWPWLDVLGTASAPDRRAVYSAAAIVVSLLGSFSAVAIGQMSSAKGARADALREAGGPDLAKNWRSIFRTALLCALVALTALLLDPSVPPVTNEPPLTPVIVRWVFELALVLAVVRFLRLSALFVEVMQVASMGDASGTAGPVDAPRPNPEWARRHRA
ncbi:hypothetical protein SAMN04487788_2191 [Microbacterium testaceum StLB037]|uniref:Uncharacterized protein n=1 Tax=Microbacterium testaceum (strain StLB037) TaxID=979556 RepID=A0A1H0Q5E2_MICTS|nr:hypothetical protein [Microbacterium testaceum]SDP11916.1 hypothetical protein SAMN04487788_2191 [Microbacterium testaceum StLB037]